MRLFYAFLLKFDIKLERIKKAHFPSLPDKNSYILGCISTVSPCYSWYSK